MLLSSGTLRKIIYEAGKLFVPDSVRNYLERKDFIEGSSFDLEIDKVFVLNEDVPAVLGDQIRQTPDLIEVKSDNLQDVEFDYYFTMAGITEEKRRKMKEGWYLESNQYYIIVSKEYTELPEGILGRLRQRRSYIISGCPVFLTDVAPGYGGTISCGIFICHKAGLILERNAKFCAYRFETFDTLETDNYNGIYGGNKVGTDGVERGF